MGQGEVNNKNRFSLESLEPRLLLSADPVLAGAAVDTTGAPEKVTAVEVMEAPAPEVSSERIEYRPEQPALAEIFGAAEDEGATFESEETGNGESSGALESRPGQLALFAADSAAVQASADFTETTLTEEHKQRLSGGLSAFGDLLQQVEENSELSDLLNSVGQAIDAAPDEGLSMADSGEPSTAFRLGLLNHLQSHLENGTNLTTGGLVDALKNASPNPVTIPTRGLAIELDPDSVSGGKDDSQNELIFNVVVTATKSFDSLPVDLGQLAHETGIVSRQNIDLSAEGSLTFDFSFGLNLSGGLSAEEAFFVRLNELSIALEGEADPLEFDVNVGLLQASVSGGSMAFDQRMAVELNNPDGDSAGRVTQAELQNTSLDALVDLNLGPSNFAATLPLTIEFEGLDFTSQPTIKLTAEDLVEGPPEVALTNFGSLEDFTSATPSGVANAIDGLVSLFKRLGKAPFLSEEVPLSDDTEIGEALQLGEVLKETLSSHLYNEDGQLNFDSLQSLIPFLSNLLGETPETIGGDYDEANKELTFSFDLEKTFQPVSGPFNFAYNLEPLEILASGSQFDLTATGALGFDLILDLSRPQASVTAGQALPGNGVLTGEASFEVELNGGGAVTVTVAPDPNNSTRTELIADINAAIQATRLDGRVAAELTSDNRLRLLTTQPGPSPTLLVSTDVDPDDSNQADDELGLPNNLYGEHNLGKRAYLESIEAEGHLSLQAEDVRASALIGFVGVAINNGSADVQVDATASFGQGNRFGVVELFSILGQEPDSLAPTVSFTASGTVVLEEITVQGGFVSSPPQSANIEIRFADATDLSTLDASLNGDFSEVLRFENLNFAEILANLKDLGDFIEGMGSGSALDAPIPFINRSPNELLELADPLLALLEDLEDERAGSIQNLEQLLNDTIQRHLGEAFPDADRSPDVAVDFAGETLTLDFGIAGAVEEDLPLSVNVGDDIPGLDELVDLTGETTLAATAEAALRVVVGVDLTDPLSPFFFISDDSNAEVTLDLAAEDIAFTAAVGPLGLFARNGHVHIHKEGDKTQPAQAALVTAAGAPGRLPIDSLSASDFDLQIDGEIDAEIPLFFPTTDPEDALAPITFQATLDDLSSGAFNGPDIQQLIDNADLTETFSDGIELFFLALEEVVDGNILGVEIPFVGPQLAEAADFLLELREQLDVAFNSATDFAETALEEALFTALGPDGADILKSRNGGQPASDDVEVTIVESNNLIDEVVIDLLLGQESQPLKQDIGFDLGLPGLGLAFEDTTIVLEMGWEFHLVFGLSRQEGFFIDTSKTDELELFLDAGFPGSKLTGTLGFLQLAATDDESDPSGLDLSIAVDLVMPPDSTGKRLTLPQITGNFLEAFDASFTGNVALNLVLEAGFAHAGEPVDALPSFLIDFHMGWDLSTQLNSSTASSPLGSKPDVSFDNARLKVGTFFEDFLRPIAETINGYLDPLRPVIDFLSQDIPPLSFGPLQKIFDANNDGDVTVLDLAQMHGTISDSTSKFIDAAILIIDIIDAVEDGDVPGRDSSLTIALGSFDFGEIDLRTQDASELDGIGSGNLTKPDQTVAEQFQALGGDAAEIFSATQETVTDGNGDDKSGKFEFKLLEPQNVVRMLMGQPIEFFTYAMPPIGFDFDFRQTIPVYSPPTVELILSAGVDFEANLTFGYDSSGIEDYLRPDGEIKDIFGGFYIKTGASVPPQLQLEGFIGGGVGVGVGLASVSGEVRLTAEADINLIDPGGGKLYFSQIASLIERQGLEVLKCLFLIEGRLSALAIISVEVATVEVFSKDIGPMTLAEFTVDPADCFTELLPDRFERVENGRFNNDSAGLAADLGTAPGLHIKGVSLSNYGDVDWYRFHVPHAGSLELNLNGQDHVQAEVSHPNGQVVDFTDSSAENKTLTLDNLPAGDYLLKISSTDDELSEYELAIEPSSASQTRVFYVNDPSVSDPTINSYYTLAPGDDANDGQSPHTPVASVDTILDQYDVGSNDIVVADSGQYSGGTALTSTESGVTLAGAPAIAYHDRPDTAPVGTVLEGSGAIMTLTGTDDILLHSLVYRGSGSASTALEVDNSTGLSLNRLDIRETTDGIVLNTSHDNALSEIEGTDSGTLLALNESHRNAITQLQADRSDRTGVAVTLDSSDDTTLTGVSVNGYATAIELSGGQSTTLADLELNDLNTALDLTRTNALTVANARVDGNGEQKRDEPEGDPGETALVADNSSAVSLQNLNLRDFAQGLQINSGDDWKINSLSIEGIATGWTIDNGSQFTLTSGTVNVSNTAGAFRNLEGGSIIDLLIESEGSGIALTDTSDFTVEQSEIHLAPPDPRDPLQDAYSATASTGNTVSGVVLTDSTLTNGRVSLVRLTAAEVNGITLESGHLFLDSSASTLIQDSDILGGQGVAIESGTNEKFMDNTIRDSAETGIRIQSATGLVIENNSIENAPAAVLAGGSESAPVSHLRIENNQFQKGQRGVYFENTSFTETTVVNNGIQQFSSVGIRSPMNADITDNRVFNSGTGISYGGGEPRLKRNEVFDNSTGLSGTGYLGVTGPDPSELNLVHGNGTGIAAGAGADVAFNRVYANTTGIAAMDNVDIHHNQVFRNTGQSIVIEGATNVTVRNNTVYAPNGDGVRVVQGSSDVLLRNNIIWTQSGYALYVETDSQSGLDSNYNNLYTSDAGILVFYQKDFNDLLNWQIEARQDLNSIGYTRPDPALDEPQFIDLANDNYRVASSTATTVNSGDPDRPFALELGPNGDPNGLRINQGAFGNTTFAAESEPAYLRILSPEFYVDFVTDQARRIEWEYFNVTGNVRLEVHQVNQGKIGDIGTIPVDNLPAELESQPPDHGSYFWSPQQNDISGDSANRYFIRIIAADDPSLTDDNREPFAVSPGGDDFYVNDDDATNDEYTSAPGDNRHTGKTPDDPKAILPALLQNYRLQAGQTVSIDTGEYMHVINTVISANEPLGNDQAFVLRGAANHLTLIDRANLQSGSTQFEIVDSDFLTLENLTLVNARAGLDVRSESIFFTGRSLTIKEPADIGVDVSGNSNDLALEGIVIHGSGGHAIRVDGGVRHITGSALYNNEGNGLDLLLTSPTRIEANEIYQNNRGIDIRRSGSGNPVVIGHADLSEGRGNLIYENVERGIDASGQVTIVGNTIFNQTSPSGYGIRSSGADVIHNVVHGNANGIWMRSNDRVEGNRVYDHRDRGIILRTSSNAVANVVYSTPVGIEVQRGATLRNNIVYDTSEVGIRLNRANGVELSNNTIYAPDGDAVRLSDSENASIRNNIFHVEAGFALKLDIPSQRGFDSDFNLFHTPQDGKVGFWQNFTRATFSDWRNASFNDTLSRARDPLFVNPAGADGALGFANATEDGADDDFHLKSKHGSFHNGSLAPVRDPGSGLAVTPEPVETIDAQQSPGIDLGDSAFPFDAEPAPNGGFINLGAYGNTPFASKSPEQYVLILAPDGGEVWPMEQHFNIHWRSHDTAGDVAIHLIRDNATNPVATLAGATSNDGQFEWAVPATLTPAEDYRVEIERLDATGASATSGRTFSISEPISFYYVNDGDVLPNGFTTAPGNDGNDGLSPGTPKASIKAVLEAYTLGSEDVIRVDAGTYPLTANVIITSADAGLTIQGFNSHESDGPVTTIDRDNTDTGSFAFELQQAEGTVIRDLQITGARIGIAAKNNGDANGARFLNNEIFGNARYGIELNSFSENVEIAGNRFYGTGDDDSPHQNSGVRANSPVNLVVSDNEFFGHRRNGLTLNSATAALVEGNTAHDNGTHGLEVHGNGPDLSIVRANESYNNDNSGIRASQAVLVSDNLVYGQTANFGRGIEVRTDAVARDNTIHSNNEGLVLRSAFGEQNRIFNNSTGVRTTRAGSGILSNTVYSNDTGVRVNNNNTLVENNLVYRNSSQAVFFDSARDVVIRNNTIEQTDGAGMALTDRSTGALVRNNILWVSNGAAASVSANSQDGYDSDYNLYHLENGASLLEWGGILFNQRLDLFYALGLEANSFLRDPQFVDPAGTDMVLGYDSDAETDKGQDDDFRLLPDSPAVDAGDPLSYFLAEPQPNGGRANLGAFGNTNNATHSPAQLMQLLTPNGLEKFQIGEEVPIEFRSAGLTSDTFVALMNAGGPQVGQWLPDRYRTDGDRRDLNESVDLSGVEDSAHEAVYQTYSRAGHDEGDRLTYQLPLPSGSYTVRLHFVSTSFEEGRRIFDIVLNDNTVRTDYDPHAVAGDRYVALIEEFNATVEPGQDLRLELINREGRPQLFGLEVRTDNPDGVDSPTADVAVSVDGGSTFAAVESSVPLDRFARGMILWTADQTTTGNTAFAKVQANQGTKPAGTSRDGFLIANAGNQYYVNDSATNDDIYTTVPGDNTASGKAPDQPMASISALLAAYSLTPGDVVHVDTGNYRLVQNIILTADDSGIVIQGPLPGDKAAVIDRDNTAASSFAFEFKGADNVTLKALHITGARHGVFADNGDNADGLKIIDSVIFSNDRDGIHLNQSNDNIEISGNEFYGQLQGNSMDQDSGIEARHNSGVIITGNLFRDHDREGLRLLSTRGGLIQDNQAIDNGQEGFDISANGSETTVVRNNELSNNRSGINANGNVLIEQNTIYGHTQRFSEGIRLSGGRAQDNVVHSNQTGLNLRGSGAVASGNHVYNNSGAGIRVTRGDSQVLENRVYSNETGIRVERQNVLIENNLVYKNSSHEVVLSGARDVVLRNNTVLATDGNAVRLLDSSRRALINNNILQAHSAPVLFASANSQRGLDSNYNLYVPSEGLVDWAGTTISSHARMFYELGIDKHSRVSSDPGFNNPAGADGFLGYDSGDGVNRGLDDDFQLQPDSIALDGGNLADYFLREPQPNGGRVNLGAFGNTPQAAQSAQATLQPLTPTQFDKYEIGEPISIEFHTSGLLQEHLVAAINAGGDTHGNWLYDRYRSTSASSRDLNESVDLSGISVPAPEAIYESYAQASSSSPLAYELPVPDGDYIVVLHFVAERFNEGQRSFDIRLNGDVVRENYDIRAEAGERYKAVTESFEVTATGDNGVQVELLNRENRPIISGIELRREKSSAVVEPSFEIAVALDGNVFETVATDIGVDRFGDGRFFWAATSQNAAHNGTVEIETGKGTVLEARSVEGFLVAGGGDNYYVNDSSEIGDILTSSVGDYLNSGKTPEAPLPTLAAVLRSYSFEQADTVFVDTGDYAALRNMMLHERHSGVTVQGPGRDGSIAHIDRGNTSNSSHLLEFRGANDVTFAHFDLTGARTAIFADRGFGANDVTILGNRIFGNDRYGLEFERGNHRLQAVDNIFFGEPENNNFDQDTGLRVLSTEELVVKGNEMFDHSGSGMVIHDTRGAVVEQNHVHDNGRHGIDISASGSTTTFVRANTVSNNDNHGIQASGSSLAVEQNQVFEQTGRFGSGIRISNGALARENVVLENTTGITLRGTSTAMHNRVYGNDEVGIEIQRDRNSVQANQIYSNGTGISAQRSQNHIENNLVYGNAEIGIDLDDTRNANVRNNTIFQPVGTGLQLRDGTEKTMLRSNIVWIEAGFGIVVTGNSQEEFSSNRNLFFLGDDPNARLGQWGGVFADTFNDWQQASGGDADSGFGEPRFFDPDGADDVFAYTEVGGALVNGGIDDNFHLLKNSPAIDRGAHVGTLPHDFDGDPRSDDPGTPNRGADRYDTTAQPDSQFDPESGDAQNWRHQDRSWDLDLPFDFEFYGRTYGKVEVASAGYIQFDTSFRNLPGGDNSAGALFNADDPVIAPVWDDIVTNGTGADDIFIDSSADQVTIRWQATHQSEDTQANVAVVLFSNGEFRFDYGEGNENLSPTVGISAGNGRNMVLAPYDQQPNLNSASSLQWSFVPGFDDIGAYEFKGSSLDDTPPVVVSTDPVQIQQGTNLQPSIDTIVVRVSEALDSIDAQSRFSYQLVRDADENGQFEDNDEFFTLQPNYETLADQVMLSVEEGLLPQGDYQFEIRSQNLRDASGNRLDGNSDDQAGGNYLRQFSIRDTAPPTVSMQIDAEDRTETGVDSLALLFNEALQAAPQVADLTLTDVDTGNPIDPVSLALTYDSEEQIARLSFPGLAEGQLPLGEYQLSVGAASVTDASGNPLDGDGDGVGGDDAVFDFTVAALQAPTAQLTVTPSSGDTGTTFELDAQGSSDPDGTIVEYQWELGDGSSASGPLVIHTFADPGTYDITLAVVDNDGATTTAQRSVTVENQAPTATFTVTPEGGGTNTEFIFDAGDSVDPDGAIQGFAWTFGDGNSATGTVVRHTYSETGVFTVTLTTADDQGASAIASQELAIGAPQVLEFIVNQGDPQRSEVRHLEVVFSQEVNLQDLIAAGDATSAVQVWKVDSQGLQIALGSPALSYDASTQALQINLTQSDAFPLADGNYEVRLDSDLIVSTANGSALKPTRPDDGVWAAEFHQLSGDTNDDGKTNDLDLFQAWLNRDAVPVDPSIGDQNSDETVDALDQVIVNYLGALTQQSTSRSTSIVTGSERTPTVKALAPDDESQTTPSDSEVTPLEPARATGFTARAPAKSQPSPISIKPANTASPTTRTHWTHWTNHRFDSLEWDPFSLWEDHREPPQGKFNITRLGN